MSQIIARLDITQDDQGLVLVEGTGAILKNKAFAYGLLELAKDIIRDGRKSSVQPASLGELPH